MVRRHLHHPLPQQEGSLRGEDFALTAHHLFPGILRCSGQFRQMITVILKSEEASKYQTLELSNELKCQFAATTEICKAVDKLITYHRTVLDDIERLSRWLATQHSYKTFESQS